MQQHNNLVFATGGSLALDKRRFFHISYKFDSNYDPVPMTIEEDPGELTIKVTPQHEVMIKRLEAFEARKTLGCWISPSSNQIP